LACPLSIADWLKSPEMMPPEKMLAPLHDLLESLGVPQGEKVED
jgi:hypothetical protein